MVNNYRSVWNALTPFRIDIIKFVAFIARTYVHTDGLAIQSNQYIVQCELRFRNIELKLAQYRVSTF